MRSVFKGWISFWESRLRFTYSSAYGEYTFAQLYKKLIVDRLPLATVILLGVGIVAFRTQPDFAESAQMIGIVAGRAMLLVLMIDVVLFCLSKVAKARRSKLGK